MPDHTVAIYEFDPFGTFSQTAGGTTTYTGPATADGSAVITDNEAGADGLTLDETGETATATTVINGTSAGSAPVYAEESWTLIDTVTGKTFQMVTFRVDSGTNTGYYMLSEIPLVAGRVYETVNFDATPDISAGDAAFTYSDYAVSDGIVEGTDGDDVIDGSYTGDPGNDVVDGNDAPGAGSVTPSQFNWSDYTDEQDLRGGVTQDTGEVSVAVTYTDVQTNEEFSAELSGGGDAIFVGAGEPFSTTSAGYILANGSADNTTIDFDFSADTAAFEDEVENVQFRISDIDGLNDGTNNFQDIVTVTAFDADGNAVTVNITGGTNHTVTGNTITAGLSNGSPSDASGSALIEIPGPVARIVVEYDNGGTTQQAIYFSDIHFDAIPAGINDDTINAGGGNDTINSGAGVDIVDGGSGDDTIRGGAGGDTLRGGTGNDTIFAGDGDTVEGEDGDDTFIIDPAELGGGTISITGGEGAETTGDTLDFNGQLVLGSIVYSNTDDAAGGLSGTATLLDGTTVTFSEIETIICFAGGTLIETPTGVRAVEDLRQGDLVVTRDHGVQPIRWTGARTVAAKDRFAPVEFAPGSMGNDKLLSVSPQHRMLVTGWQAQLMFGDEEVLVAAKHLVNGKTITRRESDLVSYHHILFDNHEVVLANGVWSESYHPGSYSLPGLDPAARSELFELFPDLRSNPIGYGPSARLCVNGHGGRLLAA